MLHVRFQYADIPAITLKHKSAVKQYVEEIFRLENKPLDFVNYIFCSDPFLLRINREYLKHDFLTDIITFDLSEAQGTKGEIYVSIERVKENASNYRTSFTNEIIRVIFHGALHLCGYNDKKKSEITIMRQKEEYYLHLFGQNKSKK